MNLKLLQEIRKIITSQKYLKKSKVTMNVRIPHILRTLPNFLVFKFFKINFVHIPPCNHSWTLYEPQVPSRKREKKLFFKNTKKMARIRRMR